MQLYSHSFLLQEVLLYHYLYHGPLSTFQTLINNYIELTPHYLPVILLTFHCTPCIIWIPSLQCTSELFIRCGVIAAITISCARRSSTTRPALTLNHSNHSNYLNHLIRLAPLDLPLVLLLVLVLVLVTKFPPTPTPIHNPKTRKILLKKVTFG